jgi:hypothetical protein
MRLPERRAAACESVSPLNVLWPQIFSKARTAIGHAKKKALKNIARKVRSPAVGNS